MKLYGYMILVSTGWIGFCEQHMHGQHMVRVKPALAICLARAELLFSPTQ